MSHAFQTRMSVSRAFHSIACRSTLCLSNGPLPYCARKSSLQQLEQAQQCQGQTFLLRLSFLTDACLCALACLCTVSLLKLGQRTQLKANPLGIGPFGRTHTVCLLYQGIPSSSSTIWKSSLAFSGLPLTRCQQRKQYN